MSTPEDVGSDDVEPVDVEPAGAGGAHGRKDRDGARSLRDLQEESGDEDEIHDLYAIDWQEACDAGVDLDLADGGEASLS